MKKFSICLAVCTFALSVSFADALTPVPSKEHLIKVTFRSVAPLTLPEIKVPTVINVQLPSDFSYRRNVVVYNKTSEIFEPSIIIGSEEKITPQNVNTSYIGNFAPSFLIDGFYDTYQDFDLPQEGSGEVSIVYSYRDSIKSNSLYLALDRYVALPNSITVKAEINGDEKIILAKHRPLSSTIVFPENASKRWIIEFVYSQPLRISELDIQNLSSAKTSSSLRFLAKPGSEYEIYLDPEVVVPIPTKESPNRNDPQGIKEASIAGAIIANKYYREADSDFDRIPDIKDNCVRTANTDQVDVDQNGRGDACDDYDRDGVINFLDNCIDEPNSNQADIDNDTIGDVCDGDESRITEKYPGIVWGGIIFAGLVFIGLFAFVAIQIRKKQGTM